MISKADIGIICAMDVELAELSSAMDITMRKKISGVEFLYGNLAGKNVVCAVCGVGKVFAAICTEAMILNFVPGVIVNSGVAGGLSESLSVCDAVVAESLVQHDMDTTYFGDPRGMISGINVVNFPCDEKLIQAVSRHIDGHYITGIIASGDAFIADEEKKKDIADTFSALACEMEGAAIAHVCYVNKTPVCVVRTISDGADGDKVMSYEAFREEAAKKSANIIINIIKDGLK